MRVIELTEYGEADVLRQAERPEPVAVPGRVRVRVSASTINPVDQAVRAGVMAGVAPHIAPPLVLGWDLAGTVLDASAGFEVGQRVVGMVPWFSEQEGTNAEVVSVDPEWLAPLPDGIDFAEAATLPLNGLTARQALELAGVRSGQTLLVTGASGAVGGFAVQLAGADVHVIAVASTQDETYVSSLGAKEVLGRSTPEELIAAVRTLAPQGVDAVIDAGLAGPSLIEVVRDGGVFVAVIPPAKPEPEREIRVERVEVASDAAQLRELVAALAAGELSTRVAGVLPLASAAEGHRRAAAGGLRGKVVLTL